MILVKRNGSEFQHELSENFLRVENSFGTMYDLFKIGMMVDVLNEKIVEVVELVNSELKNEDFEVGSSMSRQPDVYFIRNEFQDTFRKSIFISSFSFFESGLSEIVETLKNYVDVGKYDDKIEGYGKVLSGFGLLNIGGNLWGIINDMKLVRNSLTHENSRIGRVKYDDLRKKINGNKYSGITLSGDTLILTKNDILKDSIDKYERVLMEIYDNSHKITTERKQ